MTEQENDQAPPTTQELADFESLFNLNDVNDSINDLHRAKLREQVLQAYESVEEESTPSLVAYSVVDKHSPSWSQRFSVMTTAVVCLFAMFVLWSQQTEKQLVEHVVLETVDNTANERFLTQLETVNQFASKVSSPEYFQAIQLCQSEYQQEITDHLDSRNHCFQNMNRLRLQ